jgi:putative transposon-encoded protein
MYIQLNAYMVRRMKAVITQIESVVTPSGNSGHVVVPKAWIGKEAIVTLKEVLLKGKIDSLSILFKTLQILSAS